MIYLVGLKDNDATINALSRVFAAYLTEDEAKNWVERATKNESIYETKILEQLNKHYAYQRVVVVK